MIFTSFNLQGMRKFHCRGKGHVANLAASSNGSWLQERRVDLCNTGISHQPERNLQLSEQNNFVDLSEEKNDPKPKVDAIQILNDPSEEIEEIDPVALAKINITDEALLQVS